MHPYLPTRLSEPQLIIKHCRLLLALGLYSLVLGGTSLGLSVASMSEPLIVRAIKVIAELMLGICIIKRLTDEFTQEFPNFPLMQIASQSLTNLMKRSDLPIILSRT